MKNRQTRFCSDVKPGNLSQRAQRESSALDKTARIRSQFAVPNVAFGAERNRAIERYDKSRRLWREIYARDRDERGRVNSLIVQAIRLARDALSVLKR